MELVAALFVENFEMRSAPGPSTRLDITGAMFSQASAGPTPTTVSPHLVALIHCPADESGQGVFEVTFFEHRKTEIDEEEPLARKLGPPPLYSTPAVPADTLCNSAGEPSKNPKP